MDLQELKTPQGLEKWAFLYSEVRLVVAAIALLLGGVPPVVYVANMLGMSSMGLWKLLPLFWLISGAAVIYLAYRWYSLGQTVFGGHDNLDMVAFWFMVVTGLNLGLTGLSGNNIGMGLVPYSLATPVFMVAGVLYLLVAFRLWQRWNASGKRLF